MNWNNIERCKFVIGREIVFGILKSRIQLACQNFCDMTFGVLGGVDWNSPSLNACKAIVRQIGIEDTSAGDLNGKPVVYLTDHGGVKYIGPDVLENWNCPPRRLSMLKDLLDDSEEFREVDWTDGHIALLHNLIVRYVTEFSPYPYQPFRTQNIRSGDTFLDIGAFRGYLSMKAALKVGVSGAVFSVEPVSDNLAFVEAQVAANGLDNVVCMDYAVTNEDVEDVAFFVTQNQVNACVTDNISGPRNELVVRNKSVDALVRDVMRNSPRRVIASITTNGTEMELADSLLSKLVDAGAKYVEITMPVLYTQEKLRTFLASIVHRASIYKVQFPWLKLIYHK